MNRFFEWLRNLALDGVQAVRDFFTNLASDFRESDRYFKIKTGLIGGYLVVGVATALVFIPPGERNEIDAAVRVSRTEIVGGKYFLVRNLSSDPWRNVVLTLNDTYTQTWPRLRPGKRKPFFFSKFRNAQGQAPDDDVALRSLRIDCDQGVFERVFDRN